MDQSQKEELPERIDKQPMKFHPSSGNLKITETTKKIETVVKISSNNWNFEERELLKKSLLAFGYNRWSKIHLCFRNQKNMGLRVMSLSDIRAYSDSLIKSIADNLNYQNFDLKILLLTLLNCENQPPLYTEEKNDGVQTSNRTVGLPREPEFEKKKKDVAIIDVNSRDWDLNSIRQRAKPWAKRLQIMHKINNFVWDFQKYFLQINGRSPNSILDYSTMLNFIDQGALFGQKPCQWWSRIQDIHLILNTYSIGYANYNFSFLLTNKNLKYPKHIHKCPKVKTYLSGKTTHFLRRQDSRDQQPVILSIDSDDENIKKENPLAEKKLKERKRVYLNDEPCDFYSEIILQDLPNADGITRRLKKLISLIHKPLTEKGEEAKQLFSGDENDLLLIPDDQKSAIIQFLTKMGLPFDEAMKKNSYDELRIQCKNILKIDVDAKLLEKFVKCAKFVAFFMIEEESFSETIYDPLIHSEVFQNLRTLFSVKTAEKFLRNLNIIHYVRKYILPNIIQSKVYDDYRLKTSKLISQGISHFGKSFQEQFLIVTETRNTLKIISKLRESGFQDKQSLVCNLPVSFSIVRNHIENMFEYFKPIIESQNYLIMKKRKPEFLLKPNLHVSYEEPSVELVKEEQKAKTKPNLKRVKTSKAKNESPPKQAQSVQLPMNLTSSLKLMSLGKINTSVSYHTEHNLFPIGFTTVRLYNSMINPTQKCEYKCEILDGGEKPIYKVTASDDSSNPIIKDSSTGCWSNVVKRINGASNLKKEKVTISGTERFGLLDPNIIKMLEELPDARLCKKYIFKSRNSSLSFPRTVKE